MVLGIKFPAEWIHKIIQPKVMKLMNFGGEWGPGARPIRQEWVTEIRDQRLRAKVPFFFKQWGGVQKKRAGRTLEGRTWDEMPARASWSGP